MVLLPGCSASFILTMHHSLRSLLTGMEVPLEIRGWRTSDLISGSQWQVGGSTFLKIWLAMEEWILKKKYPRNVYGFVSVVSCKVL